MLVLYFSGTGNSEYIARQFADRMEADCHSIEEHVDFAALIAANAMVAFCYPIYGSCVPRILREFAVRHTKALNSKKLIIFCTQMMFSGDGAKAFARLLPGCDSNVIYAEHFNMPNNICNMWLLPIREGDRIRRQKDADKKLEQVCQDIRQGIVKKRGWGIFSHWLGLTQSAFWPGVEEKQRGSFIADGDCTRCGWCVNHCPMQNLTITAEGITQHNNCILCYRCVNFCPQKAATVLIHAKPKRQYKGIKKGGNN